MARTRSRRRVRRFIEPMNHLYDSHRDIRHFLAVIADALQQTGGAALTPTQWYDLAVAIIYFETEAVTHTADEEKSVFPRLRASRDTAARVMVHQIAKLKREHREAGRRLRAVNALLRRWLANGALQATDARYLRRHVTAVQAIFTRHFACEDEELFPLARRIFSMHQIREIEQEMVARRTGGAHPQLF